MISADDVVATLLYLLPGFVALKIHYWLGLRTRRSDLEWTLWSVLAAAPLAALAMVIAPGAPQATQIAIALVVSILLGLGMAIAWRASVAARPALALGAVARAWDAVLPAAEWVQVWTTDGRVISGAPRVIASSAEADTLDLYLEQPAWVDPETAMLYEMRGVAGYLISADSIASVQVMTRTGSDPDE